MTNSIDLSSMAVLIAVRGGKPRQTMKDDEATVAAARSMGADVEAVAATKRLWPKHLVQPVTTAELNVRNTVRSFGIPFVRSVFIVPNSLRLALEEALVVPLKQYDLAVEALFMNYANVLAIAQAQLGTGFDASVYPDASHLKAAYKLEVIPIGAAPNTASLAIGEIGKTYQQRSEVALGNALRDGTKEAIGKLADTITNLADKLRRKIEQETTTDPNYNKRTGPRFYDSLTENLQHLLDVIPELNFSGDPAINNLVSEAKLKLSISNEVLKNGSLSVKETILNDAEELLRKMQGMY